jgi:hypothetical protein
VNFSTNPQCSSQQQALETYFYLTAFVRAIVAVKIAEATIKSIAARNPQTAPFPQRQGRLCTFYLAKKRVQYVSRLFERGKAT